MNRLFRLPANKLWASDIMYVQCTTSAEGDSANNSVLCKYDVVSFTSNSYFTKEHRVSVGVAATGVPLPVRIVPRRQRQKSAPSQHIPAQLPNATTEEAAAALRERDAAIEEAAAARREKDAATEKAAAACRERDAATEEAAAARRERDAATEKAATACRARDAAIKKAAAAAKRADAWLTVARKMSNTASGRVFLAECPRELQEDVRKPYHAGSQPTM